MGPAGNMVLLLHTTDILVGNAASFNCQDHNPQAACADVWCQNGDDVCAVSMNIEDFTFLKT